MNLFCGVLAIIFAFEGKASFAVTCIAIAVLLDAMDGRVARMMGINGDFGKELDSLADVVTFGVAPALLLYTTSFHNFDGWGIAMIGLFPICGAWRLARFNTETHKVPNYFVGLPITAAGILLALFAANTHLFNDYILLILLLVLCVFMVSNVKVPNFKRFRVPRHFYVITPVMILFTFVVSKIIPSHYPLLVLLPIIIFAIFTIWRIRIKKEREKENTYVRRNP